MEIDQTMDVSTMKWEVSYAQLRSSLQMSSKEKNLWEFYYEKSSIWDHLQTGEHQEHIQYLTWAICLSDIYKKKIFYSTEKVKHTWYTPKMLKGVQWLGSTCGCNHRPTSGYISRQWHLYAMEMVLQVPTTPHPHQKTFVTWVQAGARQHKHHRFPTLECLEPTMTWAEVSIFLL